MENSWIGASVFMTLTVSGLARFCDPVFFSCGALQSLHISSNGNVSILFQTSERTTNFSVKWIVYHLKTIVDHEKTVANPWVVTNNNGFTLLSNSSRYLLVWKSRHTVLHKSIPFIDIGIHFEGDEDCYATGETAYKRLYLADLNSTEVHKCKTDYVDNTVAVETSKPKSIGTKQIKHDKDQHEGEGSGVVKRQDKNHQSERRALLIFAVTEGVILIIILVAIIIVIIRRQKGGEYRLDTSIELEEISPVSQECTPTRDDEGHEKPDEIEMVVQPEEESFHVESHSTVAEYRENPLFHLHQGKQEVMLFDFDIENFTTAGPSNIEREQKNEPLAEATANLEMALVESGATGVCYVEDKTFEAKSSNESETLVNDNTVDVETCTYINTDKAHAVTVEDETHENTFKLDDTYIQNSEKSFEERKTVL